MNKQINLPTPEMFISSQQTNDPALLMAYRAYAKQVYAACKQPTKKDDDWKFLRDFDLDASTLLAQYEIAPFIELVDGAFLCDIQYFFHRYPDKVRKILDCDADGSWKSNKAAALVEGYFTKGTVLYVPKDVQVKAPLTMHMDTRSNSLMLEKVMILAEQGSSVTIEDDFSSTENTFYMRSVSIISQEYTNIS